MGPQVAFIGLGNMGQGMAKNLVLKGNLSNPLILYNRTASRASTLAAKMGSPTVAATLLDAISPSDIIFCCLTDERAVTEVFDAILENSVQGKLFVDCSTIGPQYTSRLAARLEVAGAEFVAMPVFGEPTMAEAGKLTCVPAGAAASVARVKPFCEGVIGRAVVDLSSEEPGTASHLKSICNVIIVSLIEAVAEAHVLAEKTGLKTECLQNALTTVWGGPYGIYSDRMSSGDYHRKDPLVGIDMALRMANGILAMAKESNTELAGYQAGVGHMKAVAEYYASKGSDLGDISGIYGAVRTASGMQFENGVSSKQN